MEFTAKLNYVRVSPQKVRLVLDLIKGRRVGEALDTLLYAKKGIAPKLYKLLRSAVENANYASAEKNLDIDVDRLYVKRAVANDGPRMKRIRPAPMGRAYHYQRRISHIEIALEEKAGRNGDAGLVQTVQEGTPAKQAVKKAVKKAPAKKRVAAKKPAAKAKKQAAKKPAKKKK
jgi:large subunit ribosomal protein L22